MNLKPGDKIRMLNNCRDGHFKAGDILTYKNAETNPGSFSCEERFVNTNVYVSGTDDRYELVTEVFNVGDKVRIKGSQEVVEVLDTNGHQEVSLKIGVLLVNVPLDKLELVERAVQYEDKEFWINVYENQANFNDIKFLISAPFTTEFQAFLNRSHYRYINTQKIILKVPKK